MKGNVDGPAASAQFTDLRSITVSPSGTLYVVDQYAIRALSTDGVVTTLAGNVNEYGYDDAVGSAARFNTLGNLAVGKDGTIYVTANDAVRKLTPDGAVSTVLNARLPMWGLSGLTIDGHDNLYVGDWYGIWKLSPRGELSLFAGGKKDGNSMSRDGTGSDAVLVDIRNMTIDKVGVLYITESQVEGPMCSGTHSVVRKIDQNGVVTTIAGKPYDCFNSPGSSDGQGRTANFFYPEGITANIDGNLYVADNSNELIRRVTPDGMVTTIAGKAREQGSSD
ncbi:hypothetical protein D3870_08675 [Noviherbaspirillum cavernae]|uniref:Teneurin NHL domain-containing protein n=1 Tax=Noviherbaspirillum cavernae TaxID=2320862 RepID=A0A418X118_9BURK|nr:hypothetical protein D3870_08675 [Noviherbaspirillum cavernae]